MTTEKPAEKEKISKEEAEKLILEMGKKGMTSEKIGHELKNKGFNVKSEKMKISKILKKHNLYKDATTENIKSRIEKLKKHSEKNKGDKIMKKALMKAEARLLKFVKNL